MTPGEVPRNYPSYPLLSPLEAKALALLTEWGLAAFESNWPGDSGTNWPLVLKLGKALEEVADTHYQLGLEAPRNPGR